MYLSKALNAVVKRWDIVTAVISLLQDVRYHQTQAISSLFQILTTQKLGELSTVVNHNLCRCSSAVTSIRLDCLDHLHTLGDGSEHNVLSIQPRSRCGAQEELRSVRVWAGIGHGQDSWASVLQNKVLILKLAPVDGLPTRTVSSGEISSLAHEVWNHTVERGPFEVQRLARPSGTFLASAETPEVLGSLWNNIGTKLHEKNYKHSIP